MSALSFNTVEHAAQILHAGVPAAQQGLGWIEARLRACAAVGDAVLVERALLPPGRRLVAYLLAAEGAVLHTAALRAQLEDVLEPEMMPAAFVVLERLPRRADGAIDYAALPAPDDADMGIRSWEAPQGPVEKAVAAIWCELLGLTQVGRRDHFFELGGRSTLAAQLVFRVRQSMQPQVAMRDLYEAPVLLDFAAAVSARIHASRVSRLEAVRPEGKLRPLFLVHSCSGDIGYAHELAGWIDPDVPLYGLAAHGSRGGEAPLASVEEMAASYIHAMRAVQARGPYRVAGLGGGGIVAYEIANQLIGADQEVELLGLIDTPSAYPWPASAPAILAPVEPQFGAWLAGMSWAPPELGAGVRQELAQLAQLAQLAASAGDATDALLLRARQAGLFGPGEELPAILRTLVLRHALALALSHYARPPVAVPLTLFCAAAHTSDSTADPTLGWGLAVGRRLRTRLLQAPRQALLEAPHIETLGLALNEALHAAGQEAAAEEFAYTPRITIQGGVPGVAPLFCVPGAGASVTALAGLAGELDRSIPVHGLQPRGLCGTLAPHIDVPSAARAYLTALRGVQPAGPYRLLGHSFGGWVAFEMARQLAAAGERVASLIVLDSDAPGAPGSHFSRAATLAKLAGIFQLSVTEPIGLREADFAALDHEAQLALLLRRLIAVRLLPPRTGVQMLRGIVRVFAANLNTAYQPDTPYEGRLHLVAVPDPGDDPAQPFDPAQLLARWRRHAPQAQFWPGPGNHMTLLAPPHVAQLAAYLNPLLKESA